MKGILLVGGGDSPGTAEMVTKTIIIMRCKTMINITCSTMNSDYPLEEGDQNDETEPEDSVECTGAQEFLSMKISG